MSFLGADTVQVRDQGTRTGAGAERLDGLITDLRGAVAQVRWEGPDAVSFRDRAHGALEEASGACDRLRACTDELLGHADEQDRVSGEGHGTGGPGETGDGQEGEVPTVTDDGEAGGTEPLEEDIPLDGEGTQLEGTGQGALGDCFLLATIGSIAQEDEDFLEQHVEEVEDGIYRVTLYDENGDEIHYVVESTPEDGARLDESGNQSVYSIYERAYQMHRESLGDDDPLNFGNRVDALQTITGQEATSYDGEDSPPIEVMEQLLENGRPVTAGTGGENEPAHPDIVGQHAYKVSEVDAEAGTVTVVNPWPGNESITMTYDEYVETFSSTAVGRTEAPSRGEWIGELFDGTAGY